MNVKNNIFLTFLKTKREHLLCKTRKKLIAKQVIALPSQKFNSPCLNNILAIIVNLCQGDEEKNMSTKCTLLYKQIEIFEVCIVWFSARCFLHVLSIFRNLFNYHNCLNIDGITWTTIFLTQWVHTVGRSKDIIF